MARYLDETPLERRITRLEAKLDEVIELFQETSLPEAVRGLHESQSDMAVLIEDLHTKYIEGRDPKE